MTRQTYLIRLYWIVIGLGIVVNFLSVTQFPILFAVDEAWMLNYADTFGETGQIQTTIATNNSIQLAGTLYVVAGNVIGSLTGDSPYALRYLAFWFSLVLLGSLYTIGRILVSHTFGLLIAALASFNLMFLTTAHMGRSDLPMAACLWGGFALMLYARKRRAIGWAFVAGIGTAVSLHMHPLGALTCAAMGLWWLLDVQAARHEWRLIVAYALGGGLIAVSFFFTNIAPNLQGFLGALRYQSAASGAGGFLPQEAQIERHRTYLDNAAIEFMLMILGGVATIVLSKQQRNALRMVGLVLLIITLYGLVVGDRQFYYIVAWLPGLIILAAYALTFLPRRLRLLYTALAISSAIYTLFIVGLHVVENWNNRMLSAQASLIPYLTTDEVVYGTNMIYFTHRSQQFRSLTAAKELSAEQGISLADAARTFVPALIISSDSYLLPVLPVLVPEVHTWYLGRNVAEQFPEFTLLHRIETGMGTLDIWRRR